MIREFKGGAAKRTSLVHAVVPAILTIVAAGAAQAPQHLSAHLLADSRSPLCAEPQAAANDSIPAQESGRRISLSGSWFDIYNHRQLDAEGTSSAISLQAASASATVSVWQNPWSFETWWDYRELQGSWTERSRNLAASTAMALQRGGIALGYRGSHIRSALKLHYAPGMTAYRDAASAMGIRGDLAWQGTTLRLGTFVEHGPMLALQGDLESRSRGSGRSFPAFMTGSRWGLPISYSQKSISAGICPAVFALHADTARARQRDLTTSLDGRGASLSLWSMARTQPVNLSLSIFMRHLQAQAKGSDDKLEYCMIDSVRVTDLGGELTATLPGSLRGGLFGEHLSGNIPRGYFVAFQFSSWTLLRPLHYKITDISAGLDELGVFLGKDFRLPHRSVLESGIDGSWIHARSEIGTKERRVQVLIPYYEPEEITESSTKMILLKLNLAYRVTLGALQLRAGVMQLLPFVLDGTDSSSPSPQQGQGEQRSERMHGGTRVQVSASYNL
jgi:hypothetical protein